MVNDDHPPPDELSAFLEGQSSPKTTKRVSAHLGTGCQLCIQSLAALSQIVRALEADCGLAVPESVRQRAFDLFGISPPPSIRERLLAILLSDSRGSLHPDPVRTSPEGYSSLELMYEASGLHIALFCERDLAAWNVAGQIFQTPESDVILIRFPFFIGKVGQFHRFQNAIDNHGGPKSRA